MSSLDVLATTLAAKADKMIIAYKTSTVFSNELHKAASETPVNGALVERPFSGGPPGTARRLDTGDEAASTTRLQRMYTLTVTTCRIFGTINIPGRDEAWNQGKAGIIKLIERYPVAYLQALAQDKECWLLTAELPANFNVVSAADAAGWVTLNGAFSSGVGTGVTNGLLDFATPVSQSDTVLGLAKSRSYAHFNQYESSAGWATDGEKKLRRLYRTCAAQAGAGPNLVVPDSETYDNFDIDKLAQVRTEKVEDATEGSMLVLKLGDRAKVYHNIFLDRTLTSFSGTPAADGLIYLLNTDNWERLVRTPPKLSKFEDRTPDQDVLIAKYIEEEQYFCHRLNTQGVLTGTAV